MTTHVAAESDRIQLKDTGKPALSLAMPSRLVGTTFTIGSFVNFEIESKGLQSNWFAYQGEVNGVLTFYSAD